MSLSFKDSLESVKNNTSTTSEEFAVTMTSMDNIVAPTPVVMTEDTNYDAVAYSGDDGSWYQHSGYEYYSSFYDDNLSVVDDKKEISLSDKQVNITQEENSQFIPFEMPRYYDGYDLTKATLSVHYETENGNHGSSKPINVTYNDEKIRFGWLVDAGATFEAGKLKFEIHAYGTVVSDDGVVKGYTWKTKINESLNVLQSLCDCENVINKIDDSWMQELISDIAENVAEAIKDVTVVKQVEAAENAANAASQYAENASTAATEALNEVLGDYATTAYVDEAIAEANIFDNLDDYYTKSETYNKTEVDNIMAQRSQVQIITWEDND